MEEYQEKIINLGDICEGDQVIGSDGEWHNIKVLPIHKPKKMYRIEFENGVIECSGDHEWSLVDKTNQVVVTSDVIYKDLDFLKKLHVGRLDGPKIVNIKKIKPKLVRCIEVLDSDDNLFEILTEIVDTNNFILKVE